MLNENYKKQLEYEYMGVKQLFMFLLNEKLVDSNFNDFLLHCINKGIYDSNIIDFIDNVELIEGKEEKPKTKNRWLSFIKEYSKKNNLSYRQAMSDPNAKQEYLKFKN